jgi:hypothetical protein
MAISIFSDTIFVMDEVSRALGELQAEVKTMRREQAQIRRDLREILQWKWKLAGVAVGVSAIGTFAFQFAVAIIKKG